MGLEFPDLALAFRQDQIPVRENADARRVVAPILQAFQSFDQHLSDLFRRGVIANDTALAAASNPSDFERALNFASAPVSDTSADEKPADFELDEGEEDAMELLETDVVGR